MKTLATLAFLFVLLADSQGQPASPVENPNQTRSVSGQFIVHEPRWKADATLASRLTAGGNYVQLDGALLTVSCERIKQLLWRRLGDKPSGIGRIHLDLRAARSGNENVRIISEKFSDGWRYRVQLADVIERERFVRAIVQVLLLEIANRGAVERSTEIPLWFVEGLATELLAAGEAAGELKIFLPPPKTVVRTWNYNEEGLNANARRTNSLYWARVVLGSQPPLTFEELSWPADDQLSSAASEAYQSSAQLFVDRLLELEDGPASFRVLLAEFPRHLNWQLAFLKAFHAHFQSPLDVEKWWAVEVANFTGRDLEQTWSYAESWRKLDDLVRAEVQVHTGNGGQPLRTGVNLQTVLHMSNGIEQAGVFRQKLNALGSLRLRVSQELVGLVDDYRKVIGAYLSKQTTTTPFLPFRKLRGLVVNRAAKELSRELDALEVRREVLRPKPEKPEVQPEDISAAFR